MTLARKELARTGFKPKEPVPEPKRRTRKCAVCREPFEPRSMMHKACKPECAQALIEQQKAAAVKKERQAGLAKLKRRADYFKETQAALNKWIREVRDAEKPCISCGHTDHGQKFDAGHYITRGSRPNLALEELNLARQCHWCNVHLSGNQILFRKGLVERIGLAAVEALEADTTPRKYSIEQLQAMKADYLKRIREAKKANHEHDRAE